MTRKTEVMTPNSAFFEMSSGALFDPEDEVVELSALSVIPEGVEPSVKELPHCD